jgi:polyhydroxyalkanoate synthesis regulator phasin
MADEVTLDDLQKIYKRLETLESGLKEVVRLQKIQDDYDKDMSKIIADGTKSTRDDMKKLEGKVTDLEKKVGKK